MNLNEKLFYYLEEKKLKQADLARFLEVETALIANWKTRGTEPPARYLTNICKFLNISINEFLGIPEDILTENEMELLKSFRYLPDRDQIKWIARIEDAAAIYKEQQNMKQSS